MNTIDLELAVEKFQLVITKGPRGRCGITININFSQKSMKYLEIIIDDRLIFGNNVKTPCTKAVDACAKQTNAE